VGPGRYDSEIQKRRIWTFSTVKDSILIRVDVRRPGTRVRAFVTENEPERNHTTASKLYTRIELAWGKWEGGLSNAIGRGTVGCILYERARVTFGPALVRLIIRVGRVTRNEGRFFVFVFT